MVVGKLEKLEPRKVFSFFEEICSIPHGSGNMQQISNYLVNFAKNKGFKYEQDEHKNVIIIKEATKGFENVPAIILQGHMDMVAVQTLEDLKNLETEGLELCVSGDYLYAKNTSLGGDDGIALAYCLALLSDEIISHPRLEVIFTVDEEVGMDGAREIDLSLLQGKRLINLDSEEEGYLLAGCAGGGTITGNIPIKREKQKGICIEIKIENLFGGHSGVEIDKERGNALYILARVLRMLRRKISFSLYSFYGGEKDNAIPNRAVAKILIDKEDGAKEFDMALRETILIIKSEFSENEPNLKIKENRLGMETLQVLRRESFDAFLRFMLFMPNGIQAMSTKFEGLPETSLNLGILKIEKEGIQLVISVRSSISSAKNELLEKIVEIIKNVEGTYRITGEYPAWEYKMESQLRDKMCKLYKEIYGKEMKVIMIHAGLECGLLCEKIEGLDCVSIGPDMKDIHTTNEKLSISSTKRVWEFLLEFIQRIDSDNTK